MAYADGRRGADMNGLQALLKKKARERAAAEKAAAGRDTCRNPLCPCDEKET